MATEALAVSPEELDQLFQQVSNWGRWGADDQRGALNLITERKVRRASRLVSEGKTIGCALPLNTQGGVENPTPVVHAMLRTGGDGARSSADSFSIAPHGAAHTHLDALCHMFYKGRMYNGRPASDVTSAGALRNSIEAGRDGIVSRGVLFDMPAVLGKDWLDAGEAIYSEQLDLAERALGLGLEEGDILLLRTGRHKRRKALGPGHYGDRESGLAGLHVSTLPWLHERGVALLGCDGISDVTPSGLEGGGLPVHSLIIPAMGVHLLDNAQLDDLAEACGTYNRWEFMLTIAPLRLLGGTASPVNPIAMF